MKYRTVGKEDDAQEPAQETFIRKFYISQPGISGNFCFYFLPVKELWSGRNCFVNSRIQAATVSATRPR